jgi:tetratricopeptide (TPR) repeat protein
MNTKYKKSARIIIITLAQILLAVWPIIAQVKLTEQQWVLPTYIPEPPDKNPMFFKGESYQGASRMVYPYGLMDVISTERKDHQWKALILENEFIKLCVTPEIGGKLYYATDKSNNYNFIYKNNVVKPSNIGMLGAWVSGGIEWCVLHHHRASTFLPVDYDLRENPDGSKTIIIGETEPRHRMRWTISITAFPGKSYFEAEVKILNPTPYTNTFLYWANVAAHTNKDYQVIFPPSVDIATFHAKNNFTRWPFSTEFYNGQDFTAGVDVSRWINSPGSNSFFAWDLTEDFMGGYDHGKETGTVHIADHNIVKGAKLWEWGSGARGQATEGRLTENDGPYVEIMTGAFSDNQPDYSWIKPYEIKKFKQYWYPIKGIEGFKNANLNGALNLEKRGEDKVFVGFCPTQLFKNIKISVLKNGKTIFEKTTSLDPSAAFTQTINVPERFSETDLYAEVLNLETGIVLVSYKPVGKKPVDKLPETVKRPPLPKDIKTIEELYLTGSRIQQFYNPTLNAMDYYGEALNRDPYDIRTNTSMGNTYLKNGDYEKARFYLSRAINRLTKDYTRPSNCEALYLQGLALKASGLYNDATDTLYRATWDYAWHSAAYLELARISSIKHDYKKALGQVEESLSTNSFNNSALCLKAALLRLKTDFEGAIKILTEIIKTDPLDFRAENELYLTYLEYAKPQLAEIQLARLNKLMRDFDQNYLELAVGYINDGLFIEAGEVLRRFKGTNPIVKYYLGWLQDIKGYKDGAAKYFSEASSGSVDYIFPFRLETLTVLEKAVSYNPNDSRAFYYMGNILYDKQPQKAIGYWEKAVALDPAFGIAHRNLGWGYYHFYGDGIKAIAEYEKSISLNKTEPVYYEELDGLYEMSNAPVEKRLKLFEGNNETVKKRDDAFAREITVLTLGGKADKSVEYLEGRKFSYREGDSRVRNIIIDAHLIFGNKYFNEKNYTKALEQYLAAQVPEEEAGDARSGNRNIQVNYYIGMAYEAKGEKQKAKEFFISSANADTRSVNYIRYYQGLSNLKTGNKTKAKEIFESLITEGERRINQRPETDFFSKFGAREAENARLSDAYLLKGLGYKGLGDKVKASESLQKAVELSAGNLWAKTEL